LSSALLTTDESIQWNSKLGLVARIAASKRAKQGLISCGRKCLRQEAWRGIIPFGRMFFAVPLRLFGMQYFAYLNKAYDAPRAHCRQCHFLYLSS
jgi:hypothetical protein